MEAQEPLFRPVKRRKFLRKRPDSSLDEAQMQPSPEPEYPAPTEPTDAHFRTSQDDQAETDTSIAEIFRRRKALKARRGGIEFTAAAKPTGEGTGESSEVDLAAQDAEDMRLQGISDRFVAHTGQKVDVNKHMMTYIESEMAKRHHITTTDEPVSDITSQGGIVNPASELKVPQRQPASLGKLHEIDLGPDSKLRNIERTEAATRRLAGDEPLEEDDEKIAGSRKDRPGKDGKYWRGRRRRNSEDIKRDQLVEEVLRESKLDVYDEPEVVDQPNDDQAADDRIAEQFRRDFLDAIQSRRRGARAKTSKAAKSDVPRGPKLGGSRSARAAMREMQEKAAQK
ncbi:hypothetical protein FQN55_008985 [Onygenales sp. PD_40]|nr:hypothetical protein FQN55_008985 [Onygenales sp. PD_40]KAK2784227.1 hypothetical protein FQN53_008739 [Emmonsiellopsis sp. PD_33]